MNNRHGDLRCHRGRRHQRRRCCRHRRRRRRRRLNRRSTDGIGLAFAKRVGAKARISSKPRRPSAVYVAVNC